jgi:hypothetical protein
MSVELAASAFSKAMGLTDKQVQLLLRTGWILLVSICMCWAMGWLAFIGLAGPASAEEVESIKGDVRSIQVQLLEQSLFEVRLSQCKAETTETRRYYYTKLQEKMDLYFRLTGRNYNPPDCKEIS